MLAGNLGFKMEEVMPPSERSDKPPAELVTPPAFIAEWAASEEPVLIRSTSNGFMHFQPNPVFQRLFGLSPVADPGVSIGSIVNLPASFMRDAFASPGFKEAIAALLGKLLARLPNVPSADRDKGTLRHVAADGDDMVVLVRHGQPMGPYTLSGRMAVSDDGMVDFVALKYRGVEGLSAPDVALQLQQGLVVRAPVTDSPVAAAAPVPAGEWAEGVALARPPSTSAVMAGFVPFLAHAISEREPYQLVDADVEGLLREGMLDGSMLDELVDLVAGTDEGRELMEALDHTLAASNSNCTSVSVEAAAPSASSDGVTPLQRVNSTAEHGAR